MTLSRRATLLGLSAIATSARVKLALADAPGQQRLVVVLLRGALDGMASVVPYGDAHLAALRGPLIPPAPGQPGGMFDLGGFYGLNPALPGIHAMYQASEALAVHAVAGPYRTRSHFEAQDLLQLGTVQETGLTSGWLNRTLAELPHRRGAELPGLAAGLGVPLLLQGPQRVGAYAPEHFGSPAPDLLARIASLNVADRITGPAIGEALRSAKFDETVMRDDTPKRGGFPMLAGQVGQLLAAEGGPRIAAFQLEGWDTHGNQVGGLRGPLAGLDTGLVNLKTALGPAWNHTMVLVMTEFGRTAAVNGTAGTDHGTATAAFVLGGRVAGGRVRATWPGLAPNQLFERRDLAPTLDIRSLAKGALAAHLNLSNAALARIFPESTAAAPLQGLLRTA
ncbi:MAG: hypothetical protein B7Z81_01615 [Acidocella sp. 20-61-6]|nr:MAG: hypothetical protein B7Z81_01615 [Acidocella sp. 20-61-6]